MLLIDNLDFTAFTSVWFWVILVLVWAVTSQYILGIPFSDLQRAAKADADAQEEALTRLFAQAQRVAPPALHPPHRPRREGGARARDPPGMEQHRRGAREAGAGVKEISQ